MLRQYVVPTSFPGGVGVLPVGPSVHGSWPGPASSGMQPPHTFTPLWLALILSVNVLTYPQHRPVHVDSIVHGICFPLPAQCLLLVALRSISIDLCRTRLRRWRNVDDRGVPGSRDPPVAAMPGRPQQRRSGSRFLPAPLGGIGTMLSRSPQSPRMGMVDVMRRCCRSARHRSVAGLSVSLVWVAPLLVITALQMILQRADDASSDSAW